jgi:sugar O-acyltransferase (sialic acid O-acetyltransferase NeuD family)
MQRLVIVGAGGFGREVLQWVRDVNRATPTFEVLGFLDGNVGLHGTRLHRVPVLGDLSWLASNPGVGVTVAIGAPHVRRRIVEKLSAYEVTFPTLVHPTCLVGEEVALGEGTVLCPGSTLTTDITLGRHVIVNLDCSIGHDATLGDFVTLAPGVQVSGNVHVREGVDLGTGAVLVPGTEVGPWSVVGAGAVVSRSIPADVTAVGMPAKPIKTREAGWHLR